MKYFLAVQLKMFAICRTQVPRDLEFLKHLSHPFGALLALL